MNAVLALDAERFNLAQSVMYAVRKQIDYFVERDIVPAVVAMRQQEHDSLSALIGTQLCYNSDKHTINGIPVVICETSKNPTIYTSSLLTSEDF